MTTGEQRNISRGTKDEKLTTARNSTEAEGRKSLTLVDAEVTDPAAAMPRLAATSLPAVVTTAAVGVGSSEGMMGRGRSPGRLLPLTTAEAQL